MATIAKSIKNAVTVVDEKTGIQAINESAGIVVDCGDGLEQTITSLVVPKEQEIIVPVFDDKGDLTFDNEGKVILTTEIKIVDTIVPISELMQDADMLRDALTRYEEAYARGKAIEEANRPVMLEPSAEVIALLDEK